MIYDASAFRMRLIFKWLCLHDQVMIMKMTDDSVIVSLLKDNETGHGPIVQEFVDWCEQSFLQLNISKTKNMYVDFRKHSSVKETISIKGQTVECVDNYKYLGTVIDSKLTFVANCESVYKKANQRLHCLRKLSFFHIDRKLLTMFYRCFIESVISFSLVSWFSNLSLKNKNSLNQIVRWASKLIGQPQLNLEPLYNGQLLRLAGSILNDPSHPLYSEFQPLPSGRRFKMPVCKTKRYRNSFVPAAIKALNHT